ncbi:MAG: OmpH family outer membrane protein, partial [bacterium]|nr:OmpH family outer membrane protein [bacterium]
DQADADQVAQMRNRDQKTLEQYQSDLRGQVRSQMQSYADRVHKNTDAKLEQRAGTEQASVQREVAALAPRVGQQLAGFDASKLPPNLRSRIESIHQDFSKKYQGDAQAALDRFNKARSDLAAQYDQLHGLGGAADAATAKQIADLQKQRDTLYQKIVGEIESAARQIGQTRGLKVVLGGAVAGGTGVDLTTDVEHNLEKSHV